MRELLFAESGHSINAEKRTSAAKATYRFHIYGTAEAVPIV
jgi:hypothetical protein